MGLLTGAKWSDAVGAPRAAPVPTGFPCPNVVALRPAVPVHAVLIPPSLVSNPGDFAAGL